MEIEVIVTKRFLKNTSTLHNYLLEQFDSKIAFNFLVSLEKRIEFIKNNPLAGKQSAKNIKVRSIVLVPHNRIYYRLILNRIELLTLFDMRKKFQPY